MLVAPLSILIGVLDQHLICLSNVNHEESWSIILSTGCTLFLSREGLFRIILLFNLRAIMVLDSKPISHTHGQSQEVEFPSHPNATNQMKGGHIVIRCRPEVGRHPKTHISQALVRHTMNPRADAVGTVFETYIQANKHPFIPCQGALWLLTE